VSRATNNAAMGREFETSVLGGGSSPWGTHTLTHGLDGSEQVMRVALACHMPEAIKLSRLNE